MKINGIRPGSIGSSPSTGRLAKPEAATGASKVAVSSQARRLAEARAPEAPDAAKVARLRQSIASGDFTVDADAVAEKMFKEEM